MKKQNKTIPLDEKIGFRDLDNDDWIKVKDTKNSLQNLQEELKNELKVHENVNHLICDKIDKLFLKHIGKSGRL